MPLQRKLDGDIRHTIDPTRNNERSVGDKGWISKYIIEDNSLPDWVLVETVPTFVQVARTMDLWTF